MPLSWLSPAGTGPTVHPPGPSLLPDGHCQAPPPHKDLLLGLSPGSHANTCECRNGVRVSALSTAVHTGSTEFRSGCGNGRRKPSPQSPPQVLAARATTDPAQRAPRTSKCQPQVISRSPLLNTINSLASGTLGTEIRCSEREATWGRRVISRGHPSTL